MKVLFLTDKPPFPLHSGSALRIVNLAGHLAPGLEPYLATFGEPGDVLRNLERLGVFRDIRIVAPLPARLKTFRRFLRLDNTRLVTRFDSPRARIIEEKLTALVTQWGIDVVVGANMDVAEFVLPLRGVCRVVDDCDCDSLTMRRAWKYDGSTWSATDKARRFIAFIRTMGTERDLHKDFRLITTVSQADRRALLALNGPGAPIHVVPNGVGSEFLLEQEEKPRGRERQIAFWGNLDFPVNQAAVTWFHDKVFCPHLKPKGIVWHVIGKPPPGGLSRLAGDPQIILPGFVDDLVSYLAPVPVMVNPMVMGSGLKNKVLEAFALGLAVVTTSMGVEAFEVSGGVHCLFADSPESFAVQVMRLLDDEDLRRSLTRESRALVREKYSWDRAGRVFSNLLVRCCGRDC